MELRVEERNLLGDRIDVLLRRSTASYHQLEAISALVAACGWTLLRSHKLHVVLTEFHALIVKEDFWVERIMDSVRGEIRLSFIDIDTKVHPVLHPLYKVRPDELCQVRGRSLPHTKFDNLGC